MKKLEDIIEKIEDENFDGDISLYYNQLLKHGKLLFDKFEIKLNLFIDEGEITDINRITEIILNNMTENEVKALMAFRENNSFQTEYIKST